MSIRTVLALLLICMDIYAGLTSCIFLNRCGAACPVTVGDCIVLHHDIFSMLCT